MSDLQQQKLEAEIDALKAQATKTLAEAMKLESDKNLSKKTWRDWSIEIVKIFSALVLGVGGFATAITGYQLSEIKKERIDFENIKATKELEEKNIDIKKAQDQFSEIGIKIKNLQQELGVARKSQSGNGGALDDAIAKVKNIQKDISNASAQLNSSTDSVSKDHPLSEYIVGVQTLGVPDAVRLDINNRLEILGYTLNEISSTYGLDQRPDWFAKKSTVFYYSENSRLAAQSLADSLKEIVGKEFLIQRGYGFEVNPKQRGVTLFVNYILTP